MIEFKFYLRIKIISEKDIVKHLITISKESLNFINYIYSKLIYLQYE